MKRVLGTGPPGPFSHRTADATCCPKGSPGRSYLRGTRHEAVPRLRAMRDRSTAFTVDLLGETVLSEREAEEYAARYLDLVDVLASEAAAAWPVVPRLDRDDRGAIPAVNISVKVSALFRRSSLRRLDYSIEHLPDGCVRSCAGQWRVTSSLTWIWRCIPSRS